MGEILRSPDAQLAVEHRFIAAVVSDSTDERRQECLRLSPEAFTDYNCEQAWRKIIRADSWEIAADSAKSFLIGQTIGESYIPDREAIYLHWLRSRGFSFVDQWRLALPSPAKKKWPDPLSASELCAAPPATPDILIDGVLYRGGTMLVSGPSKSHKTYTMIAAACAIADGRPWLGFNTIKTPVLYLNLELQDFAMEKRIRQICSATGAKPSIDFHPWNLRGHDVTVAALSRELPPKINHLGAGLVVIDPHYKVSSASGGEENSNDSQGALLSTLEGLCGLNGAALAVAHHFAKGDASAKTAIDRASGGGVFARWGDVMLTFTPHEEDDAMTVEMALRNFAPVAPFVTRWEHPVWVRDGALDPAKLRKTGRTETNTADKALNALGDGMLTFGQWEKASGMSQTTFRRKKDALITAGKVEQVGTFYRRKAA